MPASATSTPAPGASATVPPSNGSSSTAATKREDTIRPMKSLFVRNIPHDFDQARCEDEFSQFPGFVSFQMLAKGKGSGFLNYDSVEHAISAKEEFTRSILKVTYKGSTSCDECSAEVTKWVNCPCKGATYCQPRCLVECHKKGHAADCVAMPTECQCLQGRKFAGAIRCVCQKITWCSVKCMEGALEAHEKNCQPRRFIPPSLRKKMRQNRQNVGKLRSQVTELKKEMSTVTKGYQKELTALRNEIQQLRLNKGGVAPGAGAVAPTPAAEDESAPVTLSTELMPKGE